MSAMRANGLPPWTAVLLLLAFGAGVGLCLLDDGQQDDMLAAHPGQGHQHAGVDVCSRVPVVAAVPGALLTLIVSAESLALPEALSWAGAHPRPLVPPPKLG